MAHLVSSCAGVVGEQRHGHVDQARAQVLAQALGLGVGPRRRGHALAQQSVHHEVEGEELAQLVAVDLE